MKQEYEDDSDLTEITILPDGRIYVFGLSEKVQGLLRQIEGECAGAPVALEILDADGAA